MIELDVDGISFLLGFGTCSAMMIVGEYLYVFAVKQWMNDKIEREVNKRLAEREKKKEV